MGWLDEGLMAMANADFGGDDGEAARESVEAARRHIRSTRTDAVQSKRYGEAYANRAKAMEGKSAAIKNRAEYHNTTDFERREQLNREYDAMSDFDKDVERDFNDTVGAEVKQEFINQKRTALALAREEHRENWRRGTVAEQDVMNEGFNIGEETEQSGHSFGKFAQEAVVPLATMGLTRLRDNYEMNSSYEGEGSPGVGLSQLLLTGNAKDALKKAIKNCNTDAERIQIVNTYIDKVMENSIFGGDYEAKLDIAEEMLNQLQFGAASAPQVVYSNTKGGELYKNAGEFLYNNQESIGALTDNAMTIVDLLGGGVGGPVTNFRAAKWLFSPGYRRASAAGKQMIKAFAERDAVAAANVNTHLWGGTLSPVKVNGQEVSQDAIRVMLEAARTGKSVDDVTLSDLSKDALSYAKAIAKKCGIADDLGKLDMYQLAELQNKMRLAYVAEMDNIVKQREVYEAVEQKTTPHVGSGKKAKKKTEEAPATSKGTSKEAPKKEPVIPKEDIEKRAKKISEKRLDEAIINKEVPSDGTAIKHEVTLSDRLQAEKELKEEAIERASKESEGIVDAEVTKEVKINRSSKEGEVVDLTNVQPEREVVLSARTEVAVRNIEEATGTPLTIEQREVVEAIETSNMEREEAIKALPAPEATVPKEAPDKALEDFRKNFSPDIHNSFTKYTESRIFNVATMFNTPAFHLLSLEDKIAHLMGLGIVYEDAARFIAGFYPKAKKAGRVFTEERLEVLSDLVYDFDPNLTKFTDESWKKFLEMKIDIPMHSDSKTVRAYLNELLGYLGGPNSKARKEAVGLFKAALGEGDLQALGALRDYEHPFLSGPFDMKAYQKMYTESPERAFRVLRGNIESRLRNGNTHQIKMFKEFTTTKEYQELVDKLFDQKITMKQFNESVEKSFKEWYRPPAKEVNEEVKIITKDIGKVVDDIEEAAAKETDKAEEEYAKAIKDQEEVKELTGDYGDRESTTWSYDREGMGDNDGGIATSDNIDMHSSEYRQRIEEARAEIDAIAKEKGFNASVETQGRRDLAGVSEEVAKQHNNLERSVPYPIQREWTRLVKEWDRARGQAKVEADKMMSRFYEMVYKPAVKEAEKNGAAPNSFNVMSTMDAQRIVAVSREEISSLAKQGNKSFEEAAEEWLNANFFNEIVEMAKAKKAPKVDVSKFPPENKVMKRVVTFSDARELETGRDASNDYIQESFREHLDNIISDTHDRIVKGEASIEDEHSFIVSTILRENVDDIGVEFISTTERAKRAKIAGDPQLNAANGWFSPDSNGITIVNNRAKDFLEQTLYHEGIHSVTSHTYHDWGVSAAKVANAGFNPSSMDDIRKAIKAGVISRREGHLMDCWMRVEAIYDAAWKNILRVYNMEGKEWTSEGALKMFNNGLIPYGMTHPEEMMAELFARGEHNEWLFHILTSLKPTDVAWAKGTKLTQKFSNLMDIFIDACCVLFNIDRRKDLTVLKEAIHSTAEIARYKTSKSYITSYGSELSKVGGGRTILQREAKSRLPIVLAANPEEAIKLYKLGKNKQEFNEGARQLLKRYAIKTSKLDEILSTPTGKYRREFDKEYAKAIDEADFWSGLRDWNGPSFSKEHFDKVMAKSAEKTTKEMTKGQVRQLQEGESENFNIVAQRNPAAGNADGVTRAQNEAAARKAIEEGRGGEIMPETGNSANETLMQETLPGMEKEQIAPNPGATWLDVVQEQSVDVLGDAAKQERIAAVTEYAQATRNASHINITIDGTTESIRMLVSNKSNTGFASANAAKRQRGQILAEFADYGLRPPEMNLVVDNGDGVLRPVTDGAEGKFYWQIDHRNDISHLVANKGEQSYANVTYGPFTALTGAIKEWVASGSTWLSKNLVRAAYGGAEKAHGLLNRLFVDDATKLRKIFSQLKNPQESTERITEFLWKQNAAEKTLDMDAFGLLPAEQEAVKQIMRMNDNVWKLKNFNNARTLNALGFKMVRVKGGKQMIGRPTNPIKTGMVWDARYGREVDAAMLDGVPNLRWYEFPTAHKVDGEVKEGTKFVTEIAMESKINPYVDKTMGYIDGHVEMRFNDKARVFIRDSEGNAVAVARDTLTAKHWVDNQKNGANFTLSGDKYGGDFISTTGTKQEARTGIELIDGKASDFYEDPLEAMKKSIAVQADEAIMQPVREQFKKDFTALYKDYFKDGVFPTSVDGLSSLAPAEAKTQLNWANRVLFRNAKEDIWQGGLRSFANKLIEHIGKTGDDAAWVYKFLDRRGLENYRRNPIAWMKHVVATAYIGLSPLRQFLVQGAQGFNALGLRLTSGDFNIMSSRFTDLMKHVYFGSKLDFKGKHGEYFKVMRDIGQLSKEANHSLIQEALDITNRESRMGKLIEGFGTYGAGLGEKTQQWLHASYLFDRFTKQHGEGWTNTKKLVEDFATQLRVLTGSQTNMARTKWETAPILGHIMQFCQSPFKNSQMLFDTTLPADMRRKVFLSQLLTFGTGTMGLATIGRAFTNEDGKLNESQYATIRDGLLGATMYAISGHAINVNNLAPSNYSEMVAAALDIAFGADDKVLSDLTGEHGGQQQNKDDTWATRIAKRFLADVPIAGFIDYRVKPVFAAAAHIGMDVFDGKKADDIISDVAELGKTIFSIPSGGNALVKAWIMNETGQYLSRKGTILKDGMNPATVLFQAFGITPYTDWDLGNTEQAQYNKTKNMWNPEAYPKSKITQAYDAMMLTMQEQYGSVKEWSAKETVLRQFMAMNYLAATWVNGDPDRMKELRDHVHRQLKLAANGDRNNYRWLYKAMTDENRDQVVKLKEVTDLMKQHYPEQYAEYMKVSEEIPGWKPEDINEEPEHKKSKSFEEKHGWAWKDTREKRERKHRRKFTKDEKRAIRRGELEYVKG